MDPVLQYFDGDQLAKTLDIELLEFAPGGGKWDVIARLVTILGGVGTLYGPLVGSVAFTGMKDLISNLIGNWELFIGFLLVFIMLAGEKGIWGSLEPRLKKVFSGKRA